VEGSRERRDVMEGGEKSRPARLPLSGVWELRARKEEKDVFLEFG